jgi:hypothetical protein
MAVAALAESGRDVTLALVVQTALVACWPTHRADRVLDASLAYAVAAQHSDPLHRTLLHWLSALLLVGISPESTGSSLLPYLAGAVAELPHAAGADARVVLLALCGAASTPVFDAALVTADMLRTLLQTAISAGQDRLAIRFLLRVMRRPGNLPNVTNNDGVLAFLLRHGR